ncbi:TIGR00341 family protein [Salinigranum sp.]|uniref:TIGR00341 family protein n=1 Tax=Salinigranum sp. TaxID=1966351 RepID=UPI00356153A1
MRLIEIFVPDDDLATVEETLTEANVEHVLVDEAGPRGGVVAHIPVPSGGVDAVLETLYDAGLDESTYTVVSELSDATVSNVDELSEQYVEGPRGDTGISHPEIRERARDLKPATATYVAFAVFSAVVAVGGLLLNSAIVIVGAMVIAPFAGSTLSASVGAVISDREMVVDSFSSQAIGLVVALAGAVVMSFFLLRTGFVPPSLVVSRLDQVGAFTTPNVLTLVIAIAAGFAGAFALATDLPVSIAGVAVAAAIVPAAATAGIGVVWGQPLVVAGALVLLLMNIVVINLAAYVGLVSLGYRSSMVRSVRENVSVSLRTGAYTLVLVLFAVAVVVTVGATAQHIAFEQQVNQDVQSVVNQEAYDSLELVGVKTEYSDMNALGRVESVTVTVSRSSSDAEYDALAETLRTRITDDTGRPVTVNVRFIDYQQSRPSAAGTSPPLDPYPRLTQEVRELRTGLGRRLGVPSVCPADVRC